MPVARAPTLSDSRQTDKAMADIEHALTIDPGSAFPPGARAAHEGKYHRGSAGHQPGGRASRVEEADSAAFEAGAMRKRGWGGEHDTCL